MQSDNRDAPRNTEKTNKRLTEKLELSAERNKEKVIVSTPAVLLPVVTDSVYRGRPPTSPDDKQTLRTDETKNILVS